MSSIGVIQGDTRSLDWRTCRDLEGHPGSLGYRILVLGFRVGGAGFRVLCWRIQWSSVLRII